MEDILSTVETCGRGSANGFPAPVLDGNWLGLVSIGVVSKSSSEGISRKVIQLQR